DGAGTPICQRLNGIEGWVAAEMLLFKSATMLGGGSGAMIRRTTFNKVGGFDERLSTSADWDLYYRIACGWKVGFAPEVLLQYRLHGSNMHCNFHAMERDMLLAFDKAFRKATPELRRLRRRSYGNLHRVLAGGFFSVGEYRKFFPHAVRSLLLTPN